MGLFGDNKKTRLFFTTDVHGSTVVFKKFINSAKFYDAQVIILGGDMVGKMIVPLVEQANHNYRANYLGKVYDVTSGTELEHLEETLENSGLYPLRVSPEEVKAFETDKSLVEKQFGQLATERVAKWLQIADERLRGTGIKCFVQPGNDDPYEIDQVFKQSDFVKNVDETVVMLDDDHEMISVGAANQTPWHCPRDLPEEELTRRIEGVIKPAQESGQCGLQSARAAIRYQFGRCSGDRRKPDAEIIPVGRVQDDLRGQQGRAGCDRKIPAPGGAAWAHPRKPLRPKDRPDHVHQSRQRIWRRRAARRDRRPIESRSSKIIRFTMG